jgi:hypothetical protein
MLVKRVGVAVLVVCMAAGVRAEEATVDQALSVEQIVAKHVDARGGLEAWRKVETMAWTGHVESPGSQLPNLPFALEMKRPDRTRFELTSDGVKSVRAFDGKQGWKVRLTRDAKPEVQSYTTDELKFAHDAPGIDGPLMDYEAKGVAVALDGVDEVEGRKAYRISVTLPSGARSHVWIDTQTFLDVKYDRLSHDLRGRGGTVAVYNRAFRTVSGLVIPTTIEIGAGSAKLPDKMVIERVAINPPLEDRTFARPGTFGRAQTVTIGAPGAR